MSFYSWAKGIVTTNTRSFLAKTKPLSPFGGGQHVLAALVLMTGWMMVLYDMVTGNSVYVR